MISCGVMGRAILIEASGKSIFVFARAVLLEAAMTACFRIFGCGMLLLGVVACSRTPGSIPQSTTAPQAVKAIEPEPKVDTVPSSPPPPQSLPALSNRVDIVLEVTSSNKPNELQ